MAPQAVASEHFSPDATEFIRLLHKHEVRYVIVGGEAVIYYGHVRLTGDVDFFYALESSNIERLFEALTEFWDAKIPGVHDIKDLGKKGQIIQFGLPPNRIDLINDVDGIDFEEAWPSRTITAIGSTRDPLPVIFIGLEQLVLNKRSVGRPKDLEDLRFLEGLVRP